MSIDRSSRVIVVCNAMDDSLRTERMITTDSPAASKKVFNMCKALRMQDIDAIILSMGRGRANGNKKSFPPSSTIIDGVPITYASFSHNRWLSEFISTFGILRCLGSLSKNKQTSVIFYNQLPIYIGALLYARIKGFKIFIDLEDGWLNTGNFFRDFLFRTTIAIFNKLSNSGALLACNALENSTSIRPCMSYYGTSEGIIKNKFNNEKITFLLSGSLLESTGARRLISVIKILRKNEKTWAKNIVFQISGFGECLEEFIELSKDKRHPEVQVHGRLSDEDYRNLLLNCDVGFALKSVGQDLADTTFPSKVIEYASHGLLVVSTDISDVRTVFREGAILLSTNDDSELISVIKEIVSDIQKSSEIAKNGTKNIVELCSPEKAGQNLKSFLTK